MGWLLFWISFLERLCIYMVAACQNSSQKPNIYTIWRCGIQFDWLLYSFSLFIKPYRFRTL